jgi:eukaryotic-like serine/threonine-protein kinase
MSMPERLGKYRITAVLGEGAMGVVYKGFDPGIQRTVALKTIHRPLVAETGDVGVSAAARFRNEAQAAGRLSHPGIVSVYDYGDEGEVAYIAMEYVEGSSLARYLAAPARFEVDQVVGLVAQLLDALGHAHSHGVWHRDVKPANLLITHEGQLKVADFGIARIESAGLTLVNSAIGTPGYMAPEQFLGEDVDRRVDIYAAGVLLYQLLVGKPPFVGSTESLMYRVVHEAPVLPSALPGHQPGAAFDGVLARALAKDRRQRYTSAADFRHALAAVLGRPPPPRLDPDAVLAPTDAPTQVMRAPASRSSGAPPPTNWDPAVLSQVEASLARHVGPLAAVMVRRQARHCTDLPALYAKLAEQVTDPTARSAFISQTSGVHTGGPPRPPVSGGSAAPAALSEVLVAQSIKLLAKHLGPIAGTLAKRAAARAAGREAFFAALEEAVTDPEARTQLRAELDRLA